jgi:hypothetical protein
MRFKAILATAILAALSAANTPALADSINFGQFGPDGTLYGNVVGGTTTGGVGFTITGAGFGFESVTANSPDWVDSQFPVGAPVLWDGSPANNGPGSVTIDFATAISSITGIAAEADLFGNYTATLTAYDGATLLGTVSYSAAGLETSPPGTLPNFNFFSAGITSIVIDTTDDGTGFALGNSVPEPGTLALFGAALLALGGLGLCRKLA